MFHELLQQFVKTSTHVQTFALIRLTLILILIILTKWYTRHAFDIKQNELNIVGDIGKAVETGLSRRKVN